MENCFNGAICPKPYLISKLRTWHNHELISEFLSMSFQLLIT